MMNENTWLAIAKGFERWPQLKASPVDAAEFDQAMRSFGTVDPDYREFVLRYGGGIVGAVPIYGLRIADLMGTIGGNASAPTVTEWFRSKNWPGTDHWLVFSIDQGGNPVGFSNDGSVWLSDQMDFVEIVQVAIDFEDYLLKWCLRTKAVGIEES